MIQQNKFIRLAIATCLLWLAFTSNALAVDLNIYAGPQSITPREIIYVTVQSDIQETTIELSYNSDNEHKVQIGTTQHGLVSFEIPAQKSVGQMQFKAKTNEGVSSTALISVFAGPPQDFTLSIKRGIQSGTLDISSSVLRDAFNNSISDLSLASLDWIDDKGLIASQNIQLTQGKIILNGTCPNNFEGDLTFRAAVNSTEYTRSNLSVFCREKSQLNGS